MSIEQVTRIINIAKENMNRPRVPVITASQPMTINILKNRVTNRTIDAAYGIFERKISELLKVDKDML